MTDHDPEIDNPTRVPTRGDDDDDPDYDTTEKVEQTETGYRLVVESTRGTGTRDQDKVKAELRTETPAGPTERAELLEHVTMAMEQRRNHKPDEESD